MASIGGYHIKNLGSRATQDPFGEEKDRKSMEFELLFGSGSLGEHTHEGFDDTGSEDYYFYENVSEDRMQKVRKDLMYLASRLVPYADKGSDIFSFLDISSSICNDALRGFTPLLRMLDDIASYAKKANKLTAAGKYYVVGQLGNYLITKTNSIQTFYIADGFSSMEEGVFHAKKYEQSANKGRLANLAVLSGGINWNLSVEDYISLYDI
jgi:hypothetical protein